MKGQGNRLADLSWLFKLRDAGSRLAWIAIGSVVVLSVSWTTTDAATDQAFKKVNESCEQYPCESGLYCVQTEKGKKCATCDQSKLNTLSGNIGDSCKTFGKGWTPAGSNEYQAVLAEDGRVLVDVFDKMLESAKKCKAAREYREHQCWNGGDDEHKGAIRDVADSIDRIAAHKNKMISDRQVYYGSKNDYTSKLSTFRSKCNLNFPDLDQKLGVMDYDQDKGKKVNCTNIEKYGNESEKCFNESIDLLNYGFARSSSKFPEEYSTTSRKAEDTMKKAKGLLKTVKDKKLCE